MPIVATSNGIKPEIRALAVILLNKPVTPSEINECVGTGNYAAKYITFLRRLGFVFESNKDGRSIVSYTLVKEPDNAKDLRSTKTKKTVEKVKAKPPVEKKKVVKTKANKAKAKVETKKVPKVEKKTNVVPNIFVSPSNSSFAIDRDWDNFGESLNSLLR